MPIYPSQFDPSLSDMELLAAVEQQTGLQPPDFISQFDSLGNDCEFGFLQRHCGAEPLGPFRFSNPEPDVVLRAITTGFAEYDAIDLELDWQQPRREWIVINTAYRLREHTYIFEGDLEEAVIRSRQLTRVGYLRRLATESLADGRKVYVIKSGQGCLKQDICSSIARAMQAAGPNTLLWVEPGEQVGMVEELAPGFLKGTIDRLTVQPNGHEHSFNGWLAVLTQAWRLVRAAKHVAA